MTNLSVIIMTFNEKGTLEAVVHEILSTLQRLSCSFEVLIIDDGSSDGSGEIAQRVARELNHVRVIAHEINQGLGGVYRTGFSEARGKYITFFPADGQFPAQIIDEFLPLVSELDIILGYLPKRGSSFLSKGLSAIERGLYKCLFGHLPKFQGIMMLRRSLLDEIELKSSGRGWAILLELIIKAYRRGYRIQSVPTVMRPRTSGKSKVNNLRTIWANFLQAIELRKFIPKEGGKKTSWLLALLLLAIILTFHLSTLLIFPHADVDEAWAASRAWGLLETGKNFGPLDKGVIDHFEGYWTFFPWLPTFIQSFGLRLFEAPNLLALRIVSLVSGIFFLNAIYWIGFSLGGTKLGILSVVLSSFSKSFLISAHLGRVDIIAAAFGFTAIAIHLNNKTARWWLGIITGLFFGLAFEVHPHSIIFGPAIFALFLIEYGWSFIRKPIFWYFSFGVLITVVFYALLHILPYPDTFFSLNSLLFSATHTPPVLTFDINIILDSIRKGVVVLFVLYPIIPIIIWIIIKQFRTDRRKIIVLSTLSLGLILGFLLLIRNKFLYYTILVFPILDILLAVYFLDFLQRAKRNTIHFWIRYAIIGVYCISSVIPLLWNNPLTDYQIVQRQINETVHPSDSIIGSQIYWFGLYDHNYYSWEELTYYQRYKPGSKLADAFEEFKPNIFIIDGHLQNYILDRTGRMSPYAEHLSLSKSELKNILDRDARLMKVFENKTFGKIYVYRFDWEKISYYH